MFPVYDTVCVMLEKSFSQWSNDDKKDFLNSEKPSPILNVNKTAKVKDKVYIRNFKKSWYSEFAWLCGSYYLNKLFCVPCLIVSVKATVWSKYGFNDFGNVTRALRKHEGSSDHMRCALGFSKLKKNLTTIEDALRENSRLYIKQFNENVQLNRRFMELPIRAVLFLGKQELAFRGHNEETTSINRGNFKELLEAFVSISPVDIQEHYKKIASIFAGNSKTIQNEIIDCIVKCIDEYVENEIKECSFFSIQVDDSTDIAHKSQCSIIIRYVNLEGKLVERFLGFHDVSCSRTSEALFNLVTRCLQNFDYKTKLVGQCFDGASVMSGQLNGLQAKIKEQAPQAVFVHCLAHRMNLVLQQSCNSITKCRIFFATISGLPPFFHHSPKRTNVADSIIGRRIPVSVITRWTSNSKVISFINKEWDSLKQVFTEIINDLTSDQASVRQSDGFLNKFHDFEFVLLVVVFNEIFGMTDILFDTLQKKSFDINLCIKQIKSVQTQLNKKRNEETFKNIFELAASKTSVQTEHRDGRTRVTLSRDQIIERYRVLYFEILDTIPLQITTRFQDMEKLHFTSKFKTYSEKFPTEALSNLKEFYSNTFTDFQRLKNELQLIYSDDQYQNMEPRLLKESLFENRSIFKEAYKLLCLILTIPSTSVSTERSFSCLKRIKSYLRSTMSEDRLTNLAKISIEKELLNELIVSQPFYDDVINKFANLKDRRIALIYKQ
ncbi:unnamed protein product [Acanthoscelides obtectus]|uniref:TTF-type domain-containing protein n=1 Tax=Acanthoscelides obtectus TaxID=200917 RepID=A0A9P0LQI7_ACAOB|nr:unnamed protein product [Acanthoscelides obtectus]CAK1650238.1 Zinc finger MYM-type protein 1 [Acanthoscelides obtectus]